MGGKHQEKPHELKCLDSRTIRTCLVILKFEGEKKRHGKHPPNQKFLFDHRSAKRKYHIFLLS